MAKEQDIVRWLASRAPAGGIIERGIGDDCAVIRMPGARRDLVFTTDMLIEGVHFLRSTHTAREAGYKALARAVSDIAAMGAKPEFCLLSLALPAGTPDRWHRQFFTGFLAAASEFGARLAGGDLARSPAGVSCDVTVCGSAPCGSALLRSGARPGDRIYISGELGGAALGLQTPRGAARRRQVRPEPRLALGIHLRTRIRATASMDLSDGLSLDLARLVFASGAAAEIEAPPCFPGATRDHSLHGGEDYELLFTVSASTRVPAVFEGLKLTPIGRIVAGKPGDVRLDGKLLAPLGYDHFRTS